MDCWICGWWKLLLAGKPRSYGYIYIWIYIYSKLV